MLLFYLRQCRRLTQKAPPYLTDPTASKTTAYAKWVIKSAVANSYLFDSYTSLMSIARFLAMESYRVSGVKGRDHLKMIETEHENLSEFE